VDRQICTFYSCTSCRKEHGFAEVLVSVVQKLGCSNIKLYRDRSGQALSAQGVEARINSRQSAHEGGKFVSRMHRLPLPPGDIHGTHFFWEVESIPGP